MAHSQLSPGTAFPLLQRVRYKHKGIPGERHPVGSRRMIFLFFSTKCGSVPDCGSAPAKLALEKKAFWRHTLNDISTGDRNVGYRYSRRQANARRRAKSFDARL